MHDEHTGYQASNKHFMAQFLILLYMYMFDYFYDLPHKLDKIIYCVCLGTEIVQTYVDLTFSSTQNTLAFGYFLSSLNYSYRFITPQVPLKLSSFILTSKSKVFFYDICVLSNCPCLCRKYFKLGLNRLSPFQKWWKCRSCQ